MKPFLVPATRVLSWDLGCTCPRVRLSSRSTLKAYQVRSGGFWEIGSQMAVQPYPPLGSVYPPGISSHPSASRIPETFVRVSRQFSETRARIARGCVPPRRVPRRCPGPFFGRRSRRCASGVKLPQLWVVGVPKGSLLVQWTERTMSWGRGVEPARGRASRARWAHHLARSGEVESPGVPRPSANVLKE